MAKLSEWQEADILPIRKTCAKCHDTKPPSEFVHPAYCQTCEKRRRSDRNFARMVAIYGLEEATRRAGLRAKKLNAAPGNKVCSHCWDEKSLSEFHTHPNVKDGHHSFCKRCNSELAKHYRSQSPGHRLALTFNTAKQTARRKGLPIDISVEYLVWLWGWQRGYCYYTGVEMRFDGSGGPASVSVDRIDSTKGYVMGNVALCCTYINTMKNDRPFSEFVEWCRLVVNSSMKSGV